MCIVGRDAAGCQRSKSKKLAPVRDAQHLDRGILAASTATGQQTALDANVKIVVDRLAVASREKARTGMNMVKDEDPPLERAIMIRR